MIINKNYSNSLILFFTAFISSIYQVFLIKQLSVTNPINSNALIFNIIITLTFVGLGIGAYFIKFCKNLKFSKIFIFLISSFVLANIFALKINFFNLLNNKILFFNILVLNLPMALLSLVIFLLPFVIMGLIFAKIYLPSIHKKKIGLIVFLHSIGYILGGLFSIFFVNFIGANILLLFSLIILLLIYPYSKIEYKIKPDIYFFGISIIIILIGILLLSLLSPLKLDYILEKERNAAYNLWAQSENVEESFFTEFEDTYLGKFHDPNYPERIHLYSGWSSYSKLDIISWEDKCISGVYNHKQHWSACPTPDYDFTFRHIIYKNLNGKGIIIGSGGGMGCLTLYSYNKTDLTCIELDPLVVKLMKTKYSKFNGDIYNKVNTLAMDGRAFLDNTNEKYNFIIFEGTDLTVATKQKSLIEVENYLYTSEGLEKSFELLGEEGILLLFHTSHKLAFEKIEESLKEFDFNKSNYLYFESSNFFPINITNKKINILIISKNVELIKNFNEILISNPEFFSKTDFEQENYEIVSDNKPFLYLKSKEQSKPFIIMAILLLSIPLINIIKKKKRKNSLYFLLLGSSLILAETFIITFARSTFNDYVLTFIIINSIILVFFSLGSLYYEFIKKRILFSPVILTVGFLLLLLFNHSWSFITKFLYLLLVLSPIFFLLGSYFPIGLRIIKKTEFPRMYLLDSIGGAAGFFIFYYISINLGINANFIITIILYSILSLIVVKFKNE